MNIAGYTEIIKKVCFYVLRKTPIVKKSHFLMSEIDAVLKFYTWYESLENDEVKKGCSIITKKLKTMGVELDNLSETLIADLIMVLTAKEASQCFLRKMRCDLEAQTPTSMCMRSWIMLNNLMCFRGLYTIAYICREKARKLALSLINRKKVSHSVAWENVIAASIEGGECTSHGMLNDLLQKGNVSKKRSDKWNLFFYALTDVDVPVSIRRKFFDASYADFLYKKNVAVVGPAPTISEDAGEIDASDVVVRISYSYSGKNCDEINKGMRADVSYFNAQFGKNLLVEHNGHLPIELMWACFKREKHAGLMQHKNAGVSCREFIGFDDMTYHGAYNMIPLAVLDLSLFMSKRVKIFHTDLMLSINRVKNYFPTSFGRDDFDMRASFRRDSIVHDPVLQYRVIKKLWNLGKVVGDNKFTYVMEIGLENYLIELERTYSVFSADVESDSA